MNFTKKFDRAFQWAGEKMGAEAKTSMSEDFRSLEMEMGLRYDGMDRLQKSMTAYVKWLGKRNEVFEDKEKGLPASYLGRTMAAHGEDFEPDSEFGNCLIVLGRANERLAANQERFVSDATGVWLESLDRNLAMMKEYQASRKKLESRRLAYDASIGKVQKAKREDFRVEEELRTCRAKYEESSEDVFRRMQDIKDAEADSIRDLTGFLDSELEYHERCLEELRRVKRSWPGAATAAAGGNTNGGGNNGYTGRSRSNTAQSLGAERIALSRTNSSLNNYSNYPDEEPEPLPVRAPIRSNTRLNNLAAASGSSTSLNMSPDKPPRPAVNRTNTLPDRRVASASGTSTPTSSYGGLNSSMSAAAAVSSLRSGLRPVGRIQTSGSYGSSNAHGDDGEDTASGGSGGRSGSPEWGDRSTSPATSYGSLSRSTSNVAVNSGVVGNGAAPVTGRKPPPPPPNRAKKPPPPPVPRRETTFST